MSVDVNSLANTIIDEVSSYVQEIDEKVQAEIDEIAAEALEEMKADSNIPENTGKYKKSFYLKLEAQGRGYKRYRLANRQYRLTHLLERSHAICGGTGRTKAHPHWEPAEKRVEEKMNKLVRNL